MASGLVAGGDNDAANGVASGAGYASLHTADPSTTGTNEVTGGSPAYARKAVTWNAAAAGQITLSNQPLFDVPAGTVAYAGLWSAVSGGTFKGKWQLTSEVFAGQGQYQLTSGSVTVS